MKDATERLLFVSIATIVGGFLGITCLGTVIAGPIPQIGEHAAADIKGAVIGAAVGAVAAWIFIDRKPPRLG